MIHRFTNRISNYNFCGKQGKNLQPLGVTKFSLKGNKYGSPIRLHQEGGKIWNRYLVQVANLWTKQHKLHKENLGWRLAILRLVLYEGKFVTTRGYTCRFERLHVQTPRRNMCRLPEVAKKQSGTGRKTHRRCFRFDLHWRWSFVEARWNCLALFVKDKNAMKRIE